MWQAEADTQLTLSAPLATAVVQSELTLANLGQNTVKPGQYTCAVQAKSVVWNGYKKISPHNQPHKDDEKILLDFSDSDQFANFSVYGLGFHVQLFRECDGIAQCGIASRKTTF